MTMQSSVPAREGRTTGEGGMLVRGDEERWVKKRRKTGEQDRERVWRQKAWRSCSLAENLSSHAKPAYQEGGHGARECAQNLADWSKAQ